MTSASSFENRVMLFTPAVTCLSVTFDIGRQELLFELFFPSGFFDAAGFLISSNSKIVSSLSLKDWVSPK